MVDTRRGRRQALAHVGGRVTCEGEDADLLALLRRALDVRPGDPAAGAHVHGFHSYAARLSPTTARRLIEGLSPRGGTVLDPFCGSGTVLVEARLCGRRALGVDASPLAERLARFKVTGVDAAGRDALLAGARRTAASAEERRLSRAGPTRRYAMADREAFDPHVLLELDGLRAAIREETPEVREALELVLSAVLTKVSRGGGEPAEAAARRRLASGFTIRFFVRKTEELVRRLQDFEGALPPGAPPGRVWVGDARKLDRVRRRSVDLLLTSPPYPGVYDYAAQHALRLRWLELGGFERVEIGARGRLSKLPARRAVETWHQDFGRCLAAFRRVLRPGGTAVLIMADTAISGTPVFAERTINELAPAHELTLVARASQPRPHFHAASRKAFGRRPRREHVLVLR